MICKGVCGQDKDPTDFPLDSSKESGRYRICKSCAVDKTQEYRAQAEIRAKAKEAAILARSFQPEKLVLPNPFQKVQTLAEISAFGFPTRQVRRGSAWDVS